MCLDVLIQTKPLPEHLGVSGDVGTRHVQLCKPFAEHVERLAQIVKELKERDEHDKIQDRVEVQRSLQSGERNDPVFSKKARLVGPLKRATTREEVDFQWVRSDVSVGLPMSLFYNKEVRKTVLMTSECVENYIRTKPGGVKETMLSNHIFSSTKLIPKLDKFIDKIDESFFH